MMSAHSNSVVAERPSSPAEPEVKYQIFVSSTFLDLKKERKIALEAILQTGNIPIALERFAARDEKDRTVIQRAVRDCDIYLIIVSHRQGDRFKEPVEDPLEPGQRRKMSYTEYEFRIARAEGKPILAFVLNNAEIEAECSKSKKDLERLGQHREFIADVRAYSYASEWSRDERTALMGSLVDGIHRQIRKLEADPNAVAGWVRASRHKHRELIDFALNNELVLDTVTRIGDFKKLDARWFDGPDEKEAAAELFRLEYLAHLLDERFDVFLESGSSVAYVAREIGATLAREVRTEKVDGTASVHLTTNNVLAYLQLWLIDRVPCSMFPWSYPVEPYGGSYGILTEVAERGAHYDGRGLTRRDLELIRDIDKPMFSLSTRIHERKVLLGAISGLQLSDDLKIEPAAGSTLDPDTGREIQENCRGFHVGSYRNKLFKRYMYDTGLPLIVFVHEAKVGCPVVAGKCHFVFDDRNQWDKFLKSYPLAIVVGCQRESMVRTAQQFRDAGLDVECGDRNRPKATAFIAHNQAFRRQMGLVDSNERSV